MFKTAEIHFLTDGVLTTLTSHYVSAGQYHSIKQSAVPARSQLSILTKKKKKHICFIFVHLLLCDRTPTIMRNKVVQVL